MTSLEVGGPPEQEPEVTIDRKPLSYYEQMSKPRLIEQIDFLLRDRADLIKQVERLQQEIFRWEYRQNDKQ